MVTLALDLSSKSSGWAVNAEDKIEYGCIASSSTDVNKRILIMRDGVLELVKKYNVERIVAEEVRPDLQNSHTQKILTYVQAAIVLAVYEYNKNIKVEFIQPNSWRSKIGIKTGAGVKRETLKAQDILFVKNKYGLDVKNDDEADAIGILNSCLNSTTPQTIVKKASQTVEYIEFV